MTLAVQQALLATVRSGATVSNCSLDLGLSTTTVQVDVDGWVCEGRRYPFTST